ncbi:Hypothetical predicted protein [Paramuricea clavata]|uniref:Uncharacterized protein n=1 Tax=Paramuricea clavata TaxID=317549 RepID=A0A7D9DR94_PARCT|nr:Hypothetical predicted protein [Paramuricea clavata]
MPFFQDNEDSVAEETTQKQLISDKETTLQNAMTEPESVEEAVQEMPMGIHGHVPENISVGQTKQADKSTVEQLISRQKNQEETSVFSRLCYMNTPLTISVKKYIYKYM